MFDVTLGVLAAVAACLLLAVVILGAALARKSAKRAKLGTATLLPQTEIAMPPMPFNLAVSSAVQPDFKHEKSSFFERSVQFWKRKNPIIDERPSTDKDYLGKMSFSLSFERDTCSLNVHLLEAVDLPAKDLLGSSDPYVRLTLLPDCKESKTTQIHRRSLNPKFNQVVSFRGHSIKKLHDMTLCMQVMDYDRFSQDDPIGEVLLPMKNVKFDHRPVYWKHLQEPTVRKEGQGELMLSICYSPETSRLTVVVIKAKDLPSKEIASHPDTYVKLWLVHQGNKWEKRKTNVKSQANTPVFNETFSFTVHKEEIAETQLAVAVMEHELIGSNNEIGHCILGKRGGDTGQKHWKDIQAKSSHPFSMWHKLTPKW